METSKPSRGYQKTLLQVAKGLLCDSVPFWFMRQAGRYLPEYRELRKKAGGFLEMVYNPERASEVTMQPIRRYSMSGAILFSDILVIPHALGQEVRFESGEGPKLDPIRSHDDFSKLKNEDIDQTLSPIYQTLREVSSKLQSEKFDDTALIGFAGSPWTVACYMVEGGGSKQFSHVKNWAYNNPETFQKLIDRVSAATIHYLDQQILNGVEIIQLFDSWVGILDQENFDRWVIEPTKEIISAIKSKHPEISVIGFPREAGSKMIDYVQKTGISVLGVDYAQNPSWVAQNLPHEIPIQGNLDPTYLLDGGAEMERAAQNLLEQFQRRPFIFNLGHGVIKETKPESVEKLCQIIREAK
ncbi:MAG: uroporphyrinogen decarboxylase [Pseudomonadota bacterium]